MTFKLLEHGNLCKCPLQYSYFLQKIPAITVQELVNANGTSVHEEVAYFQSTPVVWSYLSPWVCYKLHTYMVAYSCCSWACIPRII